MRSLCWLVKQTGVSDVSDASGHGEIREWAELTLVTDLVRILLGVLTEQ